MPVDEGKLYFTKQGQLVKIKEISIKKHHNFWNITDSGKDYQMVNGLDNWTSV